MSLGQQERPEFHATCSGVDLPVRVCCICYYIFYIISCSEVPLNYIHFLFFIFLIRCLEAFESWWPIGREYWQKGCLLHQSYPASKIHQSLKDKRQDSATSQSLKQLLRDTQLVTQSNPNFVAKALSRSQTSDPCEVHRWR